VSALLSKMLDPTVKTRFWAKVKKRGPGECWEWTASRTTRGYGKFKIASYTLVASHRVALALHTGEDPVDMFALHSCDCRICCNPEHLRWGTIKDNSRDMLERGRHRNGNLSTFRNPLPVPTPEQLKQVVAMLDAGGLLDKQIGLAVDLPYAAVRSIRQGMTWCEEVKAIRRVATAGACDTRDEVAA